LYVITHKPSQSDKDVTMPFALPHLVAGFIAVMVGYTSSVILIIQAATAAGADATQLASWLWTLGIGTRGPPC